jgi:alpha-galactosidase
VADLVLTTTVEVDDCLVVAVELTNASDDERYLLDGLTVTLPIAEHLDELLTFTGRWTRELHPERSAWPQGARTAENRRGRTSHETPPVVFAGSEGFGEWSGEVAGAHLAWSGNHLWLADRLADGRRYLQLGELLHPGEVALGPGERYHTPEVVAVWSGSGLTAATQCFHRRLRARPGHPTRPRPVLVNTWEAVYFDHDAVALRNLAERAARVGAERFVLDDGWFGSRRDDTSGLGDWVVSDDAHPDGLAPLIEHVTSLGMEFGIWVEPEMVNPDSDLYRAHPEWALATEGYPPPLGRHQLVLDLARPGAFDHVLAQLDALLRDHDIAFVKWDMNRDHIGGSGADGSAGTHAQTIAVHSLLDELRRRHPRVEFESCSSGGGRIDHAILQRTDRVWTSDCNDALERQTIQRGASMLIPPELMGAHIGPPRAHTTGRRHGLAFRAATAMFGHLGIEWDLRRLDDDELAALAEVVALHKRFRSLLHSGDVVRFDAEPALVAHGVYARDRSEAIISVARIATSPSLTPPPLRLPGLADDREYLVEHLALPTERPGLARSVPAWWSTGLRSTGRQLAVVGIQLPALAVESAVLLHVQAE